MKTGIADRAQVAARRLVAALLALLLAWPVLAADNGTAAAPAEPAADLSYRLAAGDKVRINVYGHTDLSGEFEVDGAGRLSLPLIRDVNAAGLTARELEEVIADKLSPDYLLQPQVSAEVLTYRPFYIIGEVNTPGSYAYVNGLTVMNAVALAGGFTYRAKKGPVRVRRGAAQSTLELELDAPVQPGDVIEVRERFF